MYNHIQNPIILIKSVTVTSFNNQTTNSIHIVGIVLLNQCFFPFSFFSQDIIQITNCGMFILSCTYKNHIGSLWKCYQNWTAVVFILFIYIAVGKCFMMCFITMVNLYSKVATLFPFWKLEFIKRFSCFVRWGKSRKLN